MKKGVNLNQPIEGMQRESFVHFLDEKIFTFQKNGNLQTDEESIGLTNEHSNLLCSRFKPDYKVIGVKYDGLGKRVLFFLTNPDTGYSEIGQIEFNRDIESIEDIEVQCGCDFTMELNTPLEDKEQVPYCEYKTIISDECSTEEQSKCLNFSINYPIRDIEIRREQSGTMIYWTDGKNPYRYLSLDDLDKYTTKEIPCADDEKTCFDCEKLRVFNLFDRPYIEAKSLEYGGNLPRASYVYTVAYCDMNGSEITDYFNVTGNVTIFDKDNNILQQPQLGDKTNFAVELDIKDLDNRFNYYRVAVLMMDSISGGNVQAYKFPPRPTTMPKQVHSSMNGLEKATLENIQKVRPIYETVDGIVAANNYMIAYGLKQKRSWNLQPIANLLGYFLQWQTVIANETLYADGVQDSKYGGYMRDETYPFSFRVGTDDGYLSTLNTFIARPPKPYELEIVNNRDSNSVRDLQGCSTRERNRRFEIYNTATIDNDSPCNVGEIKGTVVPRGIVETSNFEVLTQGEGTLVINPSGQFSDFKRWTEDDRDWITNPSSFSNENSHQELANIFNTLYANEHVLAVLPFELCETGNCDEGTCYDLELIEDTGHVYVKSILNPDFNYIKKVYPTEYDFTKTDACSVYILQDNRPIKEPEPFTIETNLEILGDVVIKSKDTAYVRDSISDNYTCNSSIEVELFSEPTPIVFSYDISPLFEGFTVEERLLSNIDAHYVENNKFYNKIHSNALWFSTRFEEDEEEFIIEFTKSEKCCKNDYVTSKDFMVRYHIFTNCDEYVSSGVFDIRNGKLFKFDLNDYGNKEINFVLDTPIDERPDLRLYVEGVGDFEYDTGRYPKVLTSLPECFKILKRGIEYSKVVINHDGITFAKTEDYSATCNYINPELNDCDPQPYQKGGFGYVESTEIYPDNNELYNSSNLKITREDLVNISNEKQVLDFIESYTDGENDDGTFIWKKDEQGKPLVDFTCRNIRHFRFPDNSISPFMNEMPLAEFNDSIIYPMGVSIDKDAINSFLDIAVKNNLLTQKERDSIKYFELFRGLRTDSNKSVLFKGIVNDMYKDPTDKNTYFRNFPYNTLGNNKLIKDKYDNFISHPYDSQGNSKFSLIAPEVYLYKNVRGTEVNIEGYMYGNSIGGFKKVREHSKWVILDEKGYDTAKSLAKAEIAFETLLTTTEMLIQANTSNWTVAGVSTGTGLPGFLAGAALVATFTALSAISNVLFKYKRYYSQWIQSFKDLGIPENFAQYYISQKGHYNYFKPNKMEGDKLRGIVKSLYLKPGIATTNEEGKYIRINNRRREDSLYVSFGKNSSNFLNYPTDYIRYDNEDTSPQNSSRFISSDVGCNENTDNVRRIGSPYFSIKNYVPNQYASVYDITWIQTPHRGRLDNFECETIFGGDVRISRVDFKNKFPFFQVDAVNIADRVGFKYSQESNVGNPTFYCDYDTTTTGSGLFRRLPVQMSEYNFDCYAKNGKDFYIKPQAKFYLYYYGVPHFLVESDINNNYRYAGIEMKENFASNGIDVEEWTQETVVPIETNNIFKYNPVYSLPNVITPYDIHPVDYSEKNSKKLEYSPNDAIISDQDNNEQSFDNPWLIYKPFNRTHFRTDYGKLVNMKSIESELVLCLFEHQVAIFNAVDELRERLKVENSEIGLNGVFNQRPMEYHKTELGETGTQHKAFVTTEFGHFWVDAERGKVHTIQPNGKGLTAISDFKRNGSESGVRKWFKKHLPFQITKVKGLDYLNVDNAYKDVGIVMWWDSRFKRVFITKKDYKPIKKCIEWTKDGGFVYNPTNCGTRGDAKDIKVTDSEYFEDVSWTIAYSPIYDSWVSYYDFKPNYAVSYTDYFQTGINYSNDNSEIGIWSHLITNKSFQVFYGKKYPWTIEYAIKNEYTNKVLDDISLWGSSFRYHNDIDYAEYRKKLFNEGVIYNRTNNSGILKLDYIDKLDHRKYPQKVNDVTQKISAVHYDEQINFNYFFNRVINQDSHIPIWLHDSVDIDKTINSKAVKMGGKRVLERMRGEWFLVRLTQDDSSQFKHVFKWGTSLVNQY